MCIATCIQVLGEGGGGEQVPVLLGNPRSEQHIVIPGYSVRVLKASSTTPDQLALELADILFTKDELSSSLVMQKERVTMFLGENTVLVFNIM